METLATRLKWALEKSGLSQRGLAKAAGIPSARHIGFITSGDYESPGIKTIGAIAGALRVSLDWLANGDEPAPTVEHLERVGAELKALAEEPAA